MTALDVTGKQIELRHRDYRAVITEVGAALRLLTWRGRDLVLGFGSDEIMPLYRGAVLTPWPNVVIGGRYAFDGAEHVLDVSARTGGHALHGCGQWNAWRVVRRSRRAVTLMHQIWPRPGYPFRVRVAVSYSLSSEGLRWQVSAANRGSNRAPYGSSIHPYLVAPSGSMSDWHLQLDAAAVARAHGAEPHLPVQGTAYDFRHSRVIGELALDDTYTDVVWSDAGRASAIVLDSNGEGTRLSWEPGCPWVQVYTSDWPTPDHHRRGLAVEPMTCPPDAFNTGIDLVVLEPGARHSASWWLSAVEAAAADAVPEPPR